MNYHCYLTVSSNHCHNARSMDSEVQSVSHKYLGCSVAGWGNEGDNIHRGYAFSTRKMATFDEQTYVCNVPIENREEGYYVPICTVKDNEDVPRRGFSCQYLAYYDTADGAVYAAKCGDSTELCFKKRTTENFVPVDQVDDPLNASETYETTCTPLG